MCRKMQKSIAIILTGITLLWMLPLEFLAAQESANMEKQNIKVGYWNQTGVFERKEDGSYYGLMVEYLNEIAKYTNWQYEYIETTKEEYTHDLENNVFDMIGGVYFESESQLLYSDYNMGSSLSVIVGNKKNENLDYFQLEHLRGNTIGVNEQDEEKIVYLEEYMRTNQLECEIFYYTNEEWEEEKHYQDLEHDIIDMLLVDYDATNIQFHIVSYLSTQPYFFAVSGENRTLMNEVNESMHYVVSSIRDFEESKNNKYFPDMRVFDLHFTEKELEYIEKTEVVKVAGVYGSHPFYCMNSEHQGLVLDLFDEIGKITGLTFEFIFQDTYSEALELVLNGGADLAGCFFDSDEVADSKGLVLTRSYATMNNIVVKNKLVKYPDDNLIGAVMDGGEIPLDIGAKEVKYYPSTLDAIKAVDKGEADFVYGFSARLEREIQSYQFSNVTQVSVVNKDGYVSLAMARPVTPELLSIMNKAIGSIPEETKNNLLNSNLVSVAHVNLSLSDIIYANPILFVVIAAIIVAVIVCFAIFVVRIRMSHRMMQNDLKRAEAEAESKAKGVFLSKMSHELRTPMNAILGLSELTYGMEKLPEKAKDNLAKIKASSQYLQSLINDVLDMSRIENDIITVVAEAFSMEKLLEQLTDMVQIQAKKKSLDLEVSSHIIHDRVVGDAVRIKQILVNLLSNACKFTEEGGKITLTVTEHALNDEQVEITFSVKDNGIGIAKEDQKRIFSAFEQVGNNFSRSQGVGLGLQISNNLVQIMGGELKVDSEVGKGTEFYFTITLPKEEVGATEEKKEMITNLSGLNILLAEDNELNAEIAHALLEKKGIQSKWARNGKEAVDEFNASGPGEYQLILMDIRMPIKNGLEAAKEIRESAHPDGRTIPIIAMTADSFKEDIEATKDVGMNAFVTKPVDAAYLYQVIGEQTGK